MHINLRGAAEQFVSMVGVDDEVKGGSVSFEVLVDGKKVADSGPMKSGDAPKRLQADLHGAKRLLLLVGDCDDGNSYDHADWAGAVLVLTPGAASRPQTTTATVDVTPPPAIVQEESPEPAIHGPRVIGSTPGRALLFLIPATGEKPLHFVAKNLPEGLTLDSETGIITGSLKQPGLTVVGIEVKNARGNANRKLTIVGGKHKLASRRRWVGTRGTVGRARSAMPRSEPRPTPWSKAAWRRTDSSLSTSTTAGKASAMPLARFRPTRNSPT